jgi:hypothetical protein
MFPRDEESGIKSSATDKVVLEEAEEEEFRLKQCFSSVKWRHNYKIQT